MDTYVKRAARLAPEAAQDTAVGTTKVTDVAVPMQVARGPIAGTPSVQDILRDSTPADLMVMVDLHRRYLPKFPLPASLQRALGKVWMQKRERQQ